MPSKTAKKVDSKSNTKNVKTAKLSNVFQLSYKSIELIINNLNIFGAISIIYFFLTILFVRGFSASINVAQYKSNYVGNHTKATNIATDFSAFDKVIRTSSTSSSGNGALFQSILFIIFSLVFIFVLREIYKKRKVSFGSAFYDSQYPLIQYLVVLFFLVIELIPMAIGLFIYATVFREGFVANNIEKVVWIILTISFVSVTVFLMISSLFSVFIVTLPNVRPVQALSSAWKLVRHRRVVVFRKIIFLPFALIVFVGLVNLLFVAIWPQASDFVFYGLSIIALLIAQTYLYTLYRELI